MDKNSVIMIRAGGAHPAGKTTSLVVMQSLILLQCCCEAPADLTDTVVLLGRAVSVGCSFL